MEEYFEIGQIVNTSGLKGVMKVKPFTDDITKFSNLKTIYVSIKKELKEFEIEQAEDYRNLYLKIKRNKDEKLEKDSYYIVDILGCKIITDEGKELGDIEDVFSTGSNDVYVVKDELGKQVLLPAIKDVIKKVDIKNKVITVHLLEGLL